MIPPAVDMSLVKRILIIKMSALGDIIHALPVSAALGESFPHIELTWAVEESFAPLVTGNPYIKNVLTLPKIKSKDLRSLRFHREYFSRLKDVRARSFDLTLDLQGLTKSALIATASGAKIRLGYHWLREAAGFLESAVPRRPKSVHIVDQYLDVAHFLGAKIGPPKFPFHIPLEDKAYVDDLLRECGLKEDEPFVCINPASALKIKEWSAKNYAELMDSLCDTASLKSVLITADKAAAERVKSFSKRPFINLANRTNLKQLAEVLRRSAVHICSDTGSAHIAAALNRPVITLIGPTDADRICAYGQAQNAIRHTDLCGSSCDWHHCQYAEPKCMTAIKVQEVFDKVTNTLKVESSFHEAAV